MLLTREEMTFDFAGAKLDPVKDRAILAWMMNQFLYGEITGIQVGHWLYQAPDLASARFLSRQAVEEFQHVDNFLRIMAMLGCPPERANPVVQFLATGMMGSDWAEHVALEMAAGEGFVLMAFYSVIDTLDHQGIVDILKRAVKQEERHVDFGEQQTMKAIAGKSWLRRRLLGLSLVSVWGVRRLAKFMGRPAAQGTPGPVALARVPREDDRVRRDPLETDGAPRSAARRPGRIQALPARRRGLRRQDAGWPVQAGDLPVPVVAVLEEAPLDRYISRRSGDPGAARLAASAARRRSA